MTEEQHIADPETDDEISCEAKGAPTVSDTGLAELNSCKFVREAAGARTGLVAEFWDFLKSNQKWWLLPMLIVLLLLALLIVAATNPAAAPFIYPLF